MNSIFQSLRIRLARTGRFVVAAAVVSASVIAAPIASSSVSATATDAIFGVGPAVWVGSGHTCIIEMNSPWCSGDNQFGQLGVDNTTNRDALTEMYKPAPGSSTYMNFANIFHADSGSNHFCFVTPSNAPDPSALYCYGDNQYGQLGNGTTTRSSRPTKVSDNPTSGFTNVSIQSVHAGYNTTCARKAVGYTAKLFCWGRNDQGQVGDGTTIDALLPQAVGGAIGTAGSFSAVALGKDHSCAVKDGAGVMSGGYHLYCWGNNENGQLGIGTTIDSLVPVETGITGPQQANYITAGDGFTCASRSRLMTQDGVTAGLNTGDHLMCWGLNDRGQLGTGALSADVKNPTEVPDAGRFDSSTAGTIFSGGKTTCSQIITGGNQGPNTYILFCWGANDAGQATATAGSSGLNQLTPFEIADDSTVGFNNDHPSNVDISYMGVSDSITRGFTCYGKFCWGDNSHGQLAQGDTTARVGIVALKKAAAVNNGNNGGNNGGGNTCSGIGMSLTPSSRSVSGNVGQALTVPAPVATGFSASPTYTKANGAYWPAGLNLDAATGAVTGTPTMSAMYMISSVTVANGNQMCSYNITWNITTPACTTGVPTIGGTNPTIDTSFGTGGAIAFATTGTDNVLQGGVATSDGNLVIAESVEVSGNPVIKFRKYSPAGTLVSSFGTSGVLTIDKSSGAPSENADDVAELSDGSLIAIYTVRTFGLSTSTQNYLLKLTSNGAVDTSFGTSGYATITTLSNANVRNLEVLSNDSVIVLVNSYSQMVMSNQLVKFTSTGAADSAFGTSGMVTLSGNENDFTVNSADSIFVGGSTSASPSSATVKKYTSAGVLDTAWATSGVLSLAEVGNQGDDHSVMTVATDASNKIYVAVRASTMQSMNSTSKLFRLLADGTNDSSFGSGTLLSSGSSPYVGDILVLADGNIVLSSMDMGMTPKAGVSLVSSSGVLDSSHAVNTASLQFGNCALSETQIVQLTTGEVMAFGSTYIMGSNSGDSTGSLWKLNFSGVTGGSGSGSNTGTSSGTPVPTLVTSTNAAALVRAPGSESIIINGEEVVIESNNIDSSAARTPAAYRTPAQIASVQRAGAALLQQFLASLPAGATSNVVVVNTATGAVMQNLVFDANGNSVNVPVEDIVFLDGPQLSLMIGSNNANITADGKYQVGAGGIIGVTGAGLGAGASGEVVAMSTPTLLANFQTTATGDFNKSATLPDSIGVGDHTLVVAAGTTYAMMGIRVVPAALPTTGSSSERVVIIALFTLVFGAVFFRGRRISLI